MHSNIGSGLSKTMVAVDCCQCRRLATCHREEPRQQGRINLWRSALAERSAGTKKPFVQSLHLDLAEQADMPAPEIELGIRSGRKALSGYLKRMAALGVNHILLNLLRNGCPVLEVIDELGEEVLPELPRIRPV